MDIKNVPFDEIVSIPAWNASRLGLKDPTDFQSYFKDVDDKGNLASKLFNGWNPDCGLPKLVAVNDSNRKVAENARMNEMAVYDTKYTATESFTLSIGDGEKANKIIVNAGLVRNEGMSLKKSPKYIAVTCNRRITSMPLVNAARKMRGLKPITHLDCVIVQYAGDEKESTLARELDGLRENLDKDAGQWKMSIVNILAAVWSLFINGAREADLEKIGYFQGSSGRGRKQKYYLACRSRQAVFNACKVLKRDAIDIFKGFEDGTQTFAPFEGRDAKMVRQMLTKENDIINAEGLPLLDEFIKVVTGSKRINDPKIASKESITTIIGSTQNGIVRHVLKAVTSNDLGQVGSLNHLNPICDALMNASQDTIQLLDGVLKSPHQNIIAAIVGGDDSTIEKVKKALKLS